MELTFDIEDADVRVAQRVAAKALQRTAGSIWLTLLNVLHWMCVGAFVVAALDSRGGPHLVLLALGIAMLVSFWIFLLWTHWRMHVQLRAAMGPYPIRHRVRVDEAALTLDAATGTSVLPWPQVVEVQALPRHVALRFAQGSVFAIPDRAFAEPAARAAFLDALATRRAAAR